MKRLEPFALTIVLPSGLYRFTLVPLFIDEEKTAYSLKDGDVELGEIVKTGRIWSGDKGCRFSSEEVQLIGEAIRATHGC